VEAIGDALLEDVRSKGARLAAGLASFPGVLEVRGTGLLVGAELDRPAAEVVDACRAAGVVVLSAGERVLRLAPPLTVTDAELDRGLAVIREVLS
jgi:acetylornithine/succinyldiaminopimelate/putrescine aminotransferase